MVHSQAEIPQVPERYEECLLSVKSTRASFLAGCFSKRIFLHACIWKMKMHGPADFLQTQN